MIDNIYKVGKKQWKRWNGAERLMFIEVYEHMVNNQDLYSHPKAARQIDEYWKTTAWNAAWIAADFMRNERKCGR